MSGCFVRVGFAVAVLSTICVLSLGAAGASARPAVPAAATTAQGNVFGDIASFILSNIGSTLVGDATDAVLGQVLSAVGLGDDTGAQLTAISNKLDEINGKLDALSNQVSQVLSAVEQATCANLSGQLNATRSQIDVAWNEYTAIATQKSAAARKRQAATLLNYLDTQLDFKAAELEIHNQLVSPGAGAEGLVTACGQGIQSVSKILTAASAKPVTEVLDFWQAYEAKLLLLETEDLDAHHERGAARTAYAQVKATLKQETAALLPPVPAGYFYDIVSKRLWTVKIPLVTTYADASAYASHLTQSQKRQWHIPTAEDLTNLGADCCPGTLPTGSTSSNPNGLRSFYNGLIKVAGIQMAPIAGSGFAAAVAASTGTTTSASTTVTTPAGTPLDRNHILPVINGFSNVNTGSTGIGGFLFLWYHVGNKVRYAY